DSGRRDACLPGRWLLGDSAGPAHFPARFARLSSRAYNLPDVSHTRAESLPMTPSRVLAAVLAPLCCLALALGPAPAGGGKPPNEDKVREHVLWPEGAPLAKGKGAADVPKVIVYLPQPGKA